MTIAIIDNTVGAGESAFSAFGKINTNFAMVSGGAGTVAATLTGSEIVNITQSGGFVQTTTKAISGLYNKGDVTNYGAISGIDCTTAVNAASAANPFGIKFPSGTWIMGITPTLPLGCFITTSPGSNFSGSGATALGLVNTDFQQWNVVEGINGGGNFVDVLRVNHSYGGGGMTGGRNSLEVNGGLVATSSASNTNRNYVGGQFSCQCDVNDNGTSPASSATSAGACFGLGAQAVLGLTATAYLNATAAEFNIACKTGSSVWSRSGIQISETAASAVQGTVFDGAITITRQTGAIGWQTGILFCNSSGSHPLTSTGSLVATNGAYTTANGFNISSYTFTGQSFAAAGFAVQGGGTQLDFGIGSGFHQTLHHTSGASYDTRIVSQSGTGVTGAGTLLLNCGSLGLFGASTGQAAPTGYGTPTGGARQPSFAASTITLPLLAAAVAQLIIDFKGYPLLAA